MGRDNAPFHVMSKIQTTKIPSNPLTRSTTRSPKRRNISSSIVTISHGSDIPSKILHPWRTIAHLPSAS
jgi:hypothetical protein